MLRRCQRLRLPEQRKPYVISRLRRLPTLLALRSHVLVAQLGLESPELAASSGERKQQKSNEGTTRKIKKEEVRKKSPPHAADRVRGEQLFRFEDFVCHGVCVVVTKPQLDRAALVNVPAGKDH